MDGENGGCNGRTTGRDYTMMDRMMLRFRPIAPKPVTGSSETADGGSDTSGMKNLVIPKRRPKRKYDKTRKSYKRPSTAAKKNGESRSTIEIRRNVLELKAEETDQHMKARVVVETVLKNPSTDVRVDPLALGWTDSEKMKALEGEELPGFVSDSSNKVISVNRAFEAMIADGRSGKEITAVSVPELVVKEELPPYSCRAFSCCVKFCRYGQPTGRAEEKYNTHVTIPCDVWRMDSGGFAWRLDVKAALTLGCY